jgi:hypothetical protein
VIAVLGVQVNLAILILTGGHGAGETGNILMATVFGGTFALLGGYMVGQRQVPAADQAHDEAQAQLWSEPDAWARTAPPPGRPAPTLELDNRGLAPDHRARPTSNGQTDHRHAPTAPIAAATAVEERLDHAARVAQAQQLDRRMRAEFDRRRRPLPSPTESDHRGRTGRYPLPSTGEVDHRRRTGRAPSTGEVDHRRPPSTGEVEQRGRTGRAPLIGRDPGVVGDPYLPARAAPLRRPVTVETPFWHDAPR